MQLVDQVQKPFNRLKHLGAFQIETNKFVKVFYCVLNKEKSILTTHIPIYFNATLFKSRDMLLKFHNVDSCLFYLVLCRDKHTHEVLKSSDILMFLCFQKDAYYTLMPKNLILLIVLVIDLLFGVFL